MVNTTTKYLPRAVLLNSFQRFSRLIVLAGMTTNLRPVTSSTSKGVLSVAQNMTHVGGIPIEAIDFVPHDFSIYDGCIYSTAHPSRAPPGNGTAHELKHAGIRGGLSRSPNISDGRDRSSGPRYLSGSATYHSSQSWPPIHEPCLLYTSPSPRDGLLS